MADSVADAELVGAFAESGRAATDEELRRFLAAAESAWPEIGARREGFVRHVAAHAADARLGELAAADLALAYGCLSGSPRALDAFDAVLREVFAAIRARLRLDDARRDEVLQRVRERLLVGDGRTGPKILAYSGRGALAAWTRIAALRVAYNFLAERAERERGEEPDDDLVAAAAEDDPELEVLARRYGPALKASLREALGALAPRDRALLRYSFVESLGVEGIGAIYSVHKATAARWLAAARERLFESTRARFRERVALSDAEFASIARALESYLDVSVEALLASAG